MYLLLVTLVIGLFVASLFLNLYFRMRVFKVYRRLVDARVEFETAHVLNPSRMEKEILPKYPAHAEDIRTFTSNIRYSIKMASVMVALITLFGAILMWYRHE